jgi:hypothetical protein
VGRKLPACGYTLAGQAPGGTRENARLRGLALTRGLVQSDGGANETLRRLLVDLGVHDGLICTGETYKNVASMTFAKGAALKDPTGLFNSGLEGNTRRAIDFHEGTPCRTIRPRGVSSPRHVARTTRISALRSPVCYASRVMGPIVLGRLSALASEPCSRCTAAEVHIAIVYSTTSHASPCQGFSAFALRYILLLRSCRFTDAFIISSLPS